MKYSHTDIVNILLLKVAPHICKRYKVGDYITIARGVSTEDGYSNWNDDVKNTYYYHTLNPEDIVNSDEGNFVDSISKEDYNKIRGIRRIFYINDMICDHNLEYDIPKLKEVFVNDFDKQENYSNKENILNLLAEFIEDLVDTKWSDSDYWDIDDDDVDKLAEYNKEMIDAFSDICMNDFATIEDDYTDSLLLDIKYVPYYKDIQLINSFVDQHDKISEGLLDRYLVKKFSRELNRAIRSNNKKNNK